MTIFDVPIGSSSLKQNVWSNSIFVNGLCCNEYVTLPSGCSTDERTHNLLNAMYE